MTLLADDRQYQVERLPIDTGTLSSSPPWPRPSFTNLTRPFTHSTMRRDQLLTALFRRRHHDRPSRQSTLRATSFTTLHLVSLMLTTSLVVTISTSFRLISCSTRIQQRHSTLPTRTQLIGPYHKSTPLITKFGYNTLALSHDHRPTKTITGVDFIQGERRTSTQPMTPPLGFTNLLQDSLLSQTVNSANQPNKLVNSRPYT